MTNGLLTSRGQKLKLHKLAMADNTDANWTKYRTYRNIFNKTIRASKKLHYETTLRLNANNPKKTWDTLKEMTTGKKMTQKIDKIVTNDNMTITDPLLLAEEFNNFFPKRGKKFMKRLSRLPDNPVIIYQTETHPY